MCFVTKLIFRPATYCYYCVFTHSSRLALGFTQLPIQWVQSLFPGGKVAGAWR